MRESSSGTDWGPSQGYASGARGRSLNTVAASLLPVTGEHVSEAGLVLHPGLGEGVLPWGAMSTRGGSHIP